ncbi:MAG: Hsp70 family protein [Archangiaceae bacterium]|nr:Hsp70 family protein [Archangiaceae bacterium]
MTARYALGIDLGTTHTALSYFSLDEAKPRGAGQPMLPVPQLTAPGTLEPRQLLPSFLYLPNAAEFPEGSLALPWDKKSKDVVGELARSHGAKVPTRLVSSAKSWLCHPGVDRRAAILPWGAPEDVPRVSPLDASARYLEHLREAWDHAFKKHPANEQEVIVTVPASFDAGARDLTLEAAKKAGFAEVTLLEEPQAALYAWLESHGENWRKLVKPGEVILVVDVGGGTSDFSLISVAEKGGDLALERLAVGDHILLGGDNMDLALAHALSQKLGKKLDAWQLNALTYAARAAKELLFGDPKLDAAPVTVASRGSSLMGGTLKTSLERAELEQLLTDGFFPRGRVDELPVTARRTGLQQLALPYAADPAVTRHLAAFLTRQAALAKPGDTFVKPTAVLFNGGVFKAPALKQRVLDVLGSWLGSPPKELPGADLDLSVARGAAYYGWVRQGHGIRIRGGTARSYYVGVESAMPAVPGMEPPVKALCVAPFGMEEGTQADVPPQQFGLVVGEPTRFRFFASSVRREDQVGTMLEDPEGLEEVAPIETTLEGRNAGQLVPVNLQAAVTELGALELRCVEKGGAGKWKLELNVRPTE